MPETSSQNLTSIMRLSIVATELQHTQVLFRLLCILLSSAIFFDMVDPAMLILWQPDSLMSRVAASTGHARQLGHAFATVAALLLPYLFVQVVWPACPWRRLVTRYTTLVMFAGAALWVYMAWATRGGSLSPVTWVFARNAAGSLALSFALALTLNSELARTLMEQK